MRLPLSRRSPLPAQAASLLPVGERAVAWVPLADGGWAVAGPAHLALTGPEGEVTRVAWDDVERGAWEAGTRTFTVHLGSPAPLHLVVGTGVPGRDVDGFARVLRQRVEASVVHLVWRTLPDGTRVSASVRRDAEGGLYVRTSPGDPGSPAEAAVLEEVLREARDAVGLPTA